MKKLNILRNNFLYKQHRPVFIRAVEPNYNEILTDQIKTLSEVLECVWRYCRNKRVY